MLTMATNPSHFQLATSTYMCVVCGILKKNKMFVHFANHNVEKCCSYGCESTLQLVMWKSVVVHIHVVHFASNIKKCHCSHPCLSPL